MFAIVMSKLSSSFYSYSYSRISECGRMIKCRCIMFLKAKLVEESFKYWFLERYWNIIDEIGCPEFNKLMSVVWCNALGTIKICLLHTLIFLILSLRLKFLNFASFNYSTNSLFRLITTEASLLVIYIISFFYSSVVYIFILSLSIISLNCTNSSW